MARVSACICVSQADGRLYTSTRTEALKPYAVVAHQADPCKPACTGHKAQYSATAHPYCWLREAVDLKPVVYVYTSSLPLCV